MNPCNYFVKFWKRVFRMWKLLFSTKEIRGLDDLNFDVLPRAVYLYIRFANEPNNIIKFIIMICSLFQLNCGYTEIPNHDAANFI